MLPHREDSCHIERGKVMRIAWGFGALIALVTVASADTVTLTNGAKLDGTVLQETSQYVVLKRTYSTIRLSRDTVTSVQRTATKPSTRPATTRPRVAAWGDVVTSLAAQPWAGGFRQIPATVVTVGVLRNVPYQSYYCGDGYEMNVYGDPDDPACIEIGKQKGEPADKQALINFMAGLLNDEQDVSQVKRLNPKQSLVTRNGLTMEITPPDAPDAFGGWWVSVYDDGKVEKARAKDAELAAITVQRRATKSAAATTRRLFDPENWDDDDYVKVRPRTYTSTSGGRTASNSRSSSGGGPVYVRGYTRSNGTYVSGHTRSAPSRSGGHSGGRR